MASIKRTGSNIFISDVPDFLSREEKIALLDKVEATGQPFTGSFTEALGRTESPRPEGAPEPAPPPPTREEQMTMTTPPLSREEILAQETAQREAAGQFSPVRAIGGITREAGPYAAGATIGGVLGGPAGAAIGLGGTAVANVVLDPLTNIINTQFGTEFPTPREAFNELFTRMGVAEPETSTEKIIQAASRGALDAASMVGLGQAIQATQSLAPTVTKRVGEVLAANVPEQIAGGAGGEALAQVAGQEGVGPWGQLGAGILGDILGSGAVSRGAMRARAAGTPIPTRERELIEGAQRYGDLTTSEVMAPQSQKAAVRQQTMEQIPGGTGEMQFARQQQRIKAVDDIGREFGVEISDLGRAQYLSQDLANDFLQNRKDEVVRWAGHKRDVIERLSGERIPEYEVIIDPEEGTSLVVQATDLVPEGVRTPDADTTLTARAVPSEMEVGVDNTLKLIEDARAQLIEDGLASYNPIIQTLTDWEQAIQGKNLAGIERLRRSIGKAYKDPQVAAVVDDAQKLYNRVYNSLNEDMGEYIRRQGSEADYNQWRVANQNLSNMMKDFDTTVLASAIRKGEATPELFTNLLFNNDRAIVSKAYNGLTDEGKDMARTALIGKFIEESTDVAGISPTQFSRKLKQYANQIGVAFSEEQQKQVEGLKVWLDTTARAEDVVRASRGYQGPPTSALPGSGTTLSMAVRGNPVAGLLVSTAGILGLGKLARRYESPRVRNMMIRLANTQPNTTSREELAKRLTEIIRATDPVETFTDERARGRSRDTLSQQRRER